MKSADTPIEQSIKAEIQAALQQLGRPANDLAVMKTNSSLAASTTAKFRGGEGPPISRGCNLPAAMRNPSRKAGWMMSSLLPPSEASPSTHPMY